MRSMTGFGRGTCEALTVEIKSVNNRFFEINIRLPRCLNSLEIPLKKLFMSRIKRGTVDVYVTLLKNEEALTADLDLIGQHITLANTLSEKFGIESDLKYSNIIGRGDLLKQAESNCDDYTQSCMTAAEIALNNLDDMRKIEGEAIRQNLNELMDEFCTHLDAIKECAKTLPETIKTRLAERINLLLNSIQIDEARIITEAAFLADKADINEELNRLDSHINQFRGEICCGGEKGRKLDFLTQEFVRETNTIGSKSAHLDISISVLELKNILEKIKEQIRNIE